MPEWLARLFDSYGYLIVGASIFLQNAGVPFVPAHLTLLAAGFAASRGALIAPAVAAIAAVTAFAGAALGWLIGARGGRVLVERWGARLGLTAPRLAAV